MGWDVVWDSCEVWWDDVWWGGIWCGIVVRCGRMMRGGGEV